MTEGTQEVFEKEEPPKEDEAPNTMDQKIDDKEASKLKKYLLKRKN